MKFNIQFGMTVDTLENEKKKVLVKPTVISSWTIL